VIPELPAAQNVIVVGPVASGKTFLLDAWWTKEKRVVLFDGTGEIDDDDPRVEHVHSITALKRALTTGPDVVQFFNRHQRTKYRVAFHARKVEEDFPLALRVVWQLDAERKLFIDEVQEVSHLDVTDTALRFARKRLLGLVGATQRLVDVTTTYRANARMVVLFHTHEGNDLDAIRDSWGGEARDKVEQLRPLIYDDVNKTVVQTPQALVYKRGLPMEIIELG